MDKNNARRNNMNARRRIRQRNNTRMPGSTPVYVKPDHSIVVKHIRKFKDFNLASGYFDGFQRTQPYDILFNSAWGHLLDVYESMRVTKILLRCWITNTSATTIGATSTMLYRDIVTATPNRYYEQLVTEPGSKKGRMTTSFNWTWVPIEPEDYQFYDHTQFSTMDSGRYGQLNFAGAGLANEYKPSALLEYIVYYDFKSLLKPETVSTYAVHPDILRDHERSPLRDDDDFSDSSSIVSVQVPKPPVSKPRSRIK